MRRRSFSAIGSPARSSGHRCWHCSFCWWRRRSSVSWYCGVAASTFRCSHWRFRRLRMRWPFAGPHSPAARTAGRRHARRLVRRRPRESVGVLRNRRNVRRLRRLRAFPVPYVAGRHRAARDSRERAAGPVHRIRDAALQAGRLRDFGNAYGIRGRAVRIPSSFRVGGPHSDLVFGRVAGDGDHRRHAQPARAGARRAVLHPVPRIPVDLDAELAAVLRPALRRLHRVFADRAHRRLAAADGAAARASCRSGRDGRADDRAGGADAGIPDAAARGAQRSLAARTSRRRSAASMR